MNLTGQQRTALSGLFKVLFFFALLALVIVIAASCSKGPKVSQSTDVVYDTAMVQGMIPGAICGDSAYAQVNSASLKWFYEIYREELFRQNVTKFDSRFDCNHFASYYVALAQTKFYAANFHSWTKAQSLGVGIYWYFAPRGPHAVVFALTERGIVFIEPQTGKEIALSRVEHQTAFLRML